MSLLIWALFGFAIISAIQAIVSFVLYINFHVGLAYEFHDSYIFRTSVILCVFLFDFFGTHAMMQIKKHDVSSQQQTSLPKLLFALAAIISIGLNPLKSMLDTRHLDHLFSINAKQEYMSSLNLNTFYNTIDVTTTIGLWVTICILILIYFKNHQSL